MQKVRENSVATECEVPVFRASYGRHVRLHTRWRGRSRFWCQGRCITGGDQQCPIQRLGGVSCASLATWLFILVPGAVFFGVALPRLTSVTARPFFLLPFVSVVLFAIAVGLLLATCCSDPGILPRRHIVHKLGSRTRLRALLGHDLLGTEGLEPSGVPVVDAERMVPDGLRSRGYRWCETCEIVRPPRASHCRDCDHCVMRFDHHCPFVNNCVGQRNYHFFIGFETAVLMLAAIVIPTLVWAFFSSDTGGPKSLTVIWLRFTAMTGCACLSAVALLLAGLWLYHLWLVARGETTKENITGRRRVNVGAEPALCSRRGPRLFNPRVLVAVSDSEGDSSESDCTVRSDPVTVGSSGTEC